MSTSNTLQQPLADASFETRPSMLERGSYIPWASHFRRYLNRKRENRKCLNKTVDEGPYEFRVFIPSETEAPSMQKEEDLRGDDLKHYEAEIEAMNLILISIPNEIYNSVDAFTTTKAMWQRVERLMRGTIQNQVVKKIRFNNEFDQFVAEPGEALVSVYNRFAHLMNDLERNNIIFPPVSVNTKFLNCLQPEWLKYVTQVHLAKRLIVDSFDDLFDYLQQFEKLVYASKAKKLEKSHDPLALVAYTGSSSKTTTPYYVTHLSSVVDYDDDYQGDAVQKNSDDHSLLLMLEMYKELFEPHLQELLQMFNVTTTVRKNDFLFVNALRMEEIEELSANICLMAIIQPTNIDYDVVPSYDYAFLSEVQTPSTSYANSLFAKDNHEQKYPTQPKIINNTIGDDQIDSNIIFDEPNADVNSGSI
ncbi:hypothetical protein Tco_1115571 [Tanacetum coccineum]